MTFFSENPVKKGNFAADGSYLLDVSGVFGGSRTGNVLFVSGTWGGGNIAVEISPDGEDVALDDRRWFPYAETITANDFFTFSVRFRSCRITLADATAPDLDFEVV